MLHEFNPLVSWDIYLYISAGRNLFTYSNWCAFLHKGKLELTIVLRVNLHLTFINWQKFCSSDHKLINEIRSSPPLIVEAHFCDLVFLMLLVLSCYSATKREHYSYTKHFRWGLIDDLPSTLGRYCEAGVFGLIMCKSPSPIYTSATYFNNNNYHWKWLTFGRKKMIV